MDVSERCGVVGGLKEAMEEAGGSAKDNATAMSPDASEEPPSHSP